MSLDFVREGFGAFVQEQALPYVCSNHFRRAPLLYFLALRAGQQSKSDTRIGRPGMQPILSGAPISKARQETLSASRVFVDIHTSTIDDSKEMGLNDTRPTASERQDAHYARAEFRKSRLVTPIKVGHAQIKESMDSAGGVLGSADRAVKQVVRNATDEAFAVHSTKQATAFWFGGSVNPTDSVDYSFNQNLMRWPRQLGLLSAMNSTNTYARVNRSGSSATQWQGRRVTSAFGPDIFEVIDEANIGSGSTDAAADTGVGDGGVTLVLCTKRQFRKYKRQARKEGHKYWPEGVTEMAELGFKREVIQVDNTYVTYDPLCPAGYAAGLNLGTWAFAGDKSDNWRVTDFKSMCDEGQAGGEEADQAFVITESSLICWAPYANVLFTNIQE